MTKKDNPQDTEKDIDKNEPQSRHHKLIIRWGLPAIVVIIIGLVLFGISQDPTASRDTIEPGLMRSIGPGSAPITITKYADYACFTCKAWHQRGILDQIFEAYGDQVRFVWHDFPITSANSPKAAEAGLCAHDQGLFWPYHDMLYLNAPQLGPDHLKRYAAEVGLDSQEFNQCLDTGKYREAVEQSLNAALSHGFRGVPSFSVNETRIIGPASFEQLSAAIDVILSTSSQ